jgi:hypothetical protein
MGGCPPCEIDRTPFVGPDVAVLRGADESARCGTPLVAALLSLPVLKPSQRTMKKGIIQGCGALIRLSAKVLGFMR